MSDEPRTGRVSPLRAVVAFVSGVMLHVLGAALAGMLNQSSCLIGLMVGSVVAIVPFGVMAVLDASREDGAPLTNWLLVGAVCVPLIWLVDIAIVVLILMLGYGDFHI